MAVYIAVYILIGFISLLSHDKNSLHKNPRKMMCTCYCILLILLFALRHPYMGVDLGYGSSNGYLGNFEKISQFTWGQALTVKVQNFERGYILLNKLLSIISKDQQFFIITNACLTLVPVFYVIYKESCSPTLSTVIFMGLPFFMLLFSGTRQSIAVCICFVGIRFIKNKKPVKFLITVLLAALIHDSAWIFLIAYPIYHIPMSRSLRKVTFGIIPIVFLLRYPLFNVFSKLFKENAVADNNGAIILFVVFSLIYVFCSLFSDESKETAGLKNLLLVACCIQALGGVYSTAMRAGYYFMNSLVLLIPLMIHNMKNKNNIRTVRILVGACFVLFGLYSLWTGSWSRSYPYYWFWQDMLMIGL